MEDKVIYEALVPPPRASKAENRFRRIANLCIECGMAFRHDSTLCFSCGEEKQIELARLEWKAWGIAA